MAPIGINASTPDLDGPADAGHWLQVAWLARVQEWLAYRPTATNPAGLDRVRASLHACLLRLGFSVCIHEREGAQAVLVASRPPERGERWVGLFAHYDVEEAGPGWASDPFTPSVRGGRAYGRGLADNLGPLALRLLALEGLRGLPGLLWIIQGEEEIGSPFAHQLFPTLDLPPVALWLEETGYFEHEGTQRLLVRRWPDALQPALGAVIAEARREDREHQIYDRYLNKAFGEQRCPCLVHLVHERPYLALGPNDTRSRIHAADESLPLHTLGLSYRQLRRLLEEVERCE